MKAAPPHQKRNAPGKTLTLADLKATCPAVLHKTEASVNAISVPFILLSLSWPD
ncbi:MAG: hypothetical protein LBU76_08365 [Azoarcus sp.]|nr:hypothetical protein [Azoarcus sp.]